MLQRRAGTSRELITILLLVLVASLVAASAPTRAPAHAPEEPRTAAANTRAPQVGEPLTIPAVDATRSAATDPGGSAPVDPDGSAPADTGRSTADPDRFGPVNGKGSGQRVRIVSTSGIPHGDIGDLRLSPRWEPGMPIGVTEEWGAAINDVIGAIAAREPDAVLHTGDMVEGRWTVPSDDTAAFGAARTLRERRKAASLAADTYYGYIADIWRQHGLKPLFAMGDHEYGDINSSGKVPPSDPRYRLVEARRRSWAKHFTDGGRRFRLHPARGQHRLTAYAKRVDTVGIVTIDPVVARAGGLRTRVSKAQMRWVRTVVGQLRDAGARWIIVQSEIPAIGPNRRRNTSGLVLANGRQFWDLLIKLDVDLLLSGEFHDMTTYTNNRRRPVQVTHGGALVRAHANWLVIDVYDDRLELQLEAMKGKITNRNRLWNAAKAARPPRAVQMERVRGAGKLTLRRNGKVRDRSGRLREGCALTLASSLDAEGTTGGRAGRTTTASASCRSRRT